MTKVLAAGHPQRGLAILAAAVGQVDAPALQVRLAVCPCPPRGPCSRQARHTKARARRVLHQPSRRRRRWRGGW